MTRSSERRAGRWVNQELSCGMERRGEASLNSRPKKQDRWLVCARIQIV
jgi:hypothetical protein